MSAFNRNQFNCFRGQTWKWTNRRHIYHRNDINCRPLLVAANPKAMSIRIVAFVTWNNAIRDDQITYHDIQSRGVIFFLNKSFRETGKYFATTLGKPTLPLPNLRRGVENSPKPKNFEAPKTSKPFLNQDPITEEDSSRCESHVYYKGLRFGSPPRNSVSWPMLSAGILSNFR